MKSLAQIAPLTALLVGLTLSGVGCVGTSVDDTNAVERTEEASQADDAFDAPPWQVGEEGEGGDWNGGLGLQFPPSNGGGYGFGQLYGGGDDWQSPGLYGSGQGQAYGGQPFGFPPSYGGNDGIWQTSGDGDDGIHHPR
jgi:hypothetical protein